jgi:RNA polymerase sigma-70 factor, ECF subfamily
VTFYHFRYYGGKKGQMIVTINMTERNYPHQSLEQINAEMLLIKAAQKDPQCFEPLYTAYYKRIVAYVYHRVENKEHAFEISSNVFYKALDHLSTYQNKGLPFSAWLFRIASNELNQFFRKNKSSRIVSIDSEGIEELKSDMEELRTDEQDASLYTALESLETEEMELIDMRFFEKRSFKEISDITETGESACKMRVYRILEKLKSKLNNS